MASFKNNLLKNSFWGFTSSLANRMGGLVFTILLARFLLPEKFGIYTLALSIAMIFFTFADLGVNSTLVRYLSKAISKNKKQASSYYHYLLRLKLLFVISASLLLLILAHPIAFYVYKNPALFAPLLVASLYIFLLSLENFYSQIFYAIEKVNYASLKETIHQILRIALAFPIFYFVAESYQVAGVFTALVLTALVMLLFAWYYTKKLIPDLYKKPGQEINKKRIKIFLGFLTIASISAIFFSYIDSLMLGIFVSPEFVGFYRASFSLVFGVVGLVSFTNTIFLSAFTKLKQSKLSNVLNKAFKYLSIVSIPAVFGLFILGRFFVKALYGVNYLPSTMSLLVLCFLIFPTVSVGLFLSLFSAEEKPQIFAKLILITTGINIILNYIFIKFFLTFSPIHATLGAALATLISWLFYFSVSVRALKKHFDLKLDLKQIINPLIASILMSLVLLISLSKIPNMNLLTGISLILLGFLIYFLTLILLDKELVIELKEFKNILLHKTKQKNGKRR